MTRLKCSTWEAGRAELAVGFGEDDGRSQRHAAKETLVKMNALMRRLIESSEVTESDLTRVLNRALAAVLLRAGAPEV